MGTTADKLNKLLETKAAIKNAIIAKGVEVTDSDTFASYPDAIRRIETGSSEGGGEELTGSYVIAKFPDDMDGGDNFIRKATELDVSHLDVSSMWNMNRMFEGCSNLTSLDLSNFDTSNVTEMDFMFRECNNLTTLDIRNFDMSNVAHVGAMFWGCDNLQELKLDNCDHDTIEKIINSEEFPTGEVEGEAKKMYVNPDNIDGLEAPENWIFVDSYGNEIEIEEPEIYQVGYYRGNSEITEVSTLVTKEHTDLSRMFESCDNLQIINGIEQWDTSNVTEMDFMFRECNNLTTLDVSNFNTSNVTEMSYMFNSCNNLTSLDVSNWNTSKVTNMSDMFYHCSNLTTLDLSSFDTSSVTDMDFMFGYCDNLRYLDIRNFNMNIVFNKDRMFENCDNLHTLRLDNCNYDTIDKIINGANLPTGDIDGIYRKLYVQEENLINPDNQDERLTAPEGWKFVYVAGNPQDTYDSDSKPFKEDRDIQEVNVAVTKENEDLSEMFSGCENLEVIHNIDTWETGNVTNMSNMFQNCYKLTSLDVSNFDTSNVTNMSWMFDWCCNLIYLDIRNFVISDSTDIGNMFDGCEKLQVLRLDNCNDLTINRIINDTELPTGDIDGRLRKMYIPEKYATNLEENGLTAPDGWEFAYVQVIKE